MMGEGWPFGGFYILFKSSECYFLLSIIDLISRSNKWLICNNKLSDIRDIALTTYNNYVRAINFI